MGAYTVSPHEVAGRVFFAKHKDHQVNGDCKTQLPKVFKNKTLLNKRFQPVNLPVVPYAVVAPEPMVLTGMFVNCPPDYLLISSILADSLRGPPAQA